MNEVMGYEEPSQKQLEARSPSPLETLKRSRLSLQDKLNRTNAAIKAMEDHPEVTKVLELIAAAR